MTFRGALLALVIGTGPLAAATCDLSLDGITLATLSDAVGLPVTVAGGDADGARHLICHDRFCLQYNTTTKTPDWVLARLSPEITDGTHPRPEVDFKPDPDVIGGGLASAVDEDYLNSLYDRGHMAASDDFKCSNDWMVETFVFSNAVPQIGHGFNRDIWRALENRIKKFGRQEELFVLTGPIPMRADGTAPQLSAGQNGCNNDITLTAQGLDARPAICGPPGTPCTAGVTIPAGVFKIVYIPRTGRAFGFAMANQDHFPARNALDISIDAYLERWRTSISGIEHLAGLDFFPQFDLRQDRIVEDTCTPTRWR